MRRLKPHPVLCSTCKQTEIIYVAGLSRDERKRFTCYKCEKLKAATPKPVEARPS